MIFTRLKRTLFAASPTVIRAGYIRFKQRCFTRVGSIVNSRLPNTISLEPTSQCNLKCVMCPLTLGTSSTGQSNIFLSAAHWRMMVGEIGGCIENVIFGGFGEPTLHPNFHKMLIDLDKSNIRSSFSTNGISIRKNLLEVLPTLNHLTHVNVSIDSPDPIIYSVIRGGKITKALKTVRTIAQCGGKFTFTVSSLAMDGNIKTLKAFPKKLAELGVRNYIVQSLWGRRSEDGIDGDLYKNPDAASEIVDLKRIAEEHGIALQYQMPERINAEVTRNDDGMRSYFSSTKAKQSSKVCMLPWESIHIDASGAVFPCCNASGENEEKLGHLSVGSIDEIWSGAAYEEFRKRLLLKDGRSCPTVCARCSVTAAGVPPIKEYNAEIVSLQIRTKKVEIAVRNCGSESWTSARHPMIGTADPHNRPSTLFHSSWVSADRPAGPEQSLVKPGEVTKYNFMLGNNTRSEPSEVFQLVVDGVLWIPKAKFAISHLRQLSSLNRALSDAANPFKPFTSRSS